MKERHEWGHEKKEKDRKGERQRDTKGGKEKLKIKQ